MRLDWPDLLRAGIAFALLVVLVAVVAIVRGGGEERILTARFAAATNLVEGASVTAGGRAVGKVERIELADGQAELRMAITDDAVWPLPEGTKAQIRFGGTVSYSNRYVELRPGPRGARALRSGARLATADALSPVEIDEVLDTFDADARKDLGRLVDAGATTLGPRGETLGRGLDLAGPATAAAAELLAQFGDDPQALQTLAAQGARTAQVLRGGADDLVALADDAGATFDGVARRAAATRATLRALPPTLEAATGTLRRMRPTLTRLDEVVTDLAPGAAGLRRLGGPLATAVSTLDDVAPRLRGTLRTLRSGAPAITGMLTSATPLLRELRPSLAQLQPMLACVRPFTTAVAAFATNWGATANHYDAQGHVGYIAVTEAPLPDVMPINPAQIQALIPGLNYAYMRPAGYNAGDRWFQPQCGAGPEGLDPKADPEVAP